MLNALGPEFGDKPDPGDPADPIHALSILIADDRLSNVTMLERLLGGAGYLHVHSTTEAEKVPELVAGLLPQLLLLDLHMPGLDGFALMERLAPIIRARELTVVVLTADTSVYSRRRALSLGARDFLTKPTDHIEVLRRVRNLLETRYLELQLEGQSNRLRERVGERTEELDGARRELLERLALVAEYRDYATAAHTNRVGRTARLVAEGLGLDSELVDMYGYAAPLHDIGKLAVPDSILLKPGPLDDAEWGLMREHVRVGAEILGGSHSPVLQLGEEIALYHHERWDGTGYSAHLAGNEIPLSGRITAIADVFDALTHERPYKSALPVDEAVAEIKRQSGHQFDPSLVPLFMALDHAVLV